MDGLYPDFAFVTVELRGVNVTVTLVKGGHAGLFACGRGVYTEPKIWYLGIAIE